MKLLPCAAASILLFSTIACSQAAPPDAAAPDIRSAIAAQRNAPQLTDFYNAVGWKAAWSPDAAKALDDILARRARHGLDHMPFDIKAADGATPAQADVNRTRVALAYAGALSRGAVDPSSLHEIYTISRPAPNLAAGLAKAIADDRVDEWFEQLAPQDMEYKALSDAYLHYREEAAKAPATRVPTTGGTIKPGDSDPRMSEIAQQLAASGYLASVPADRQRYTPQIATAVKALQRDFGIAEDGVIGPETIKVLSMGPAARARATAVALERRRWLVRDPATTRIDVNIAAAQLSYWRDGKLADRRKVIVGEPGHETPQLETPMFRLVANPSWTVPRSIQKAELAGKSQAYFQSRNMVWKDGWIVQQPGPDNALGLVKFDLRNDHAIYLHDTNARTLFDRSQRQLSHGCVRVHDALGFAQMLAQQQGVEAEWRKARETGKESFVNLTEPIPVRLLYHPVFVTPEGTVQVRVDAYGWDGPIAERLGFDRQSRATMGRSGADIGP